MGCISSFCFFFSCVGLFVMDDIYVPPCHVSSFYALSHPQVRSALPHPKTGRGHLQGGVLRSPQPLFFTFHGSPQPLFFTFHGSPRAPTDPSSPLPHQQKKSVPTPFPQGPRRSLTNGERCSIDYTCSCPSLLKTSRSCWLLECPFVSLVYRAPLVSTRSLDSLMVLITIWA